MVPMDAAVIPLPMEETTPPVTKTYFGTGTLFYAGASPSARRVMHLAAFGALVRWQYHVVRSSSVSLRTDRQLRNRGPGVDRRGRRLVLLPTLRLALDLRGDSRQAARGQLPRRAGQPGAHGRASLRPRHQHPHHHLPPRRGDPGRDRFHALFQRGRALPVAQAHLPRPRGPWWPG